MGYPRELLDRVEPRFWGRVDVANVNECWSWQGPLTRRGYGRVSISNTTLHAHRVGWELLVGPAPEDRDVDHVCRNRRCVNPMHLRLLTHAANGSDNSYRARTACAQGHPYDDANTYWYRAQRHCRACQRNTAAKYRERCRALAG